MKTLLFSKASPQIKEASTQISYFVACLLMLVSILFGSIAQAKEFTDADLVNAYNSLFGNQSVTKPQNHKKKITPSNDIDLVAAYHLLFPEKKSQSVVQKKIKPYKKIPRTQSKKKIISVSKKSAKPKGFLKNKPKKKQIDKQVKRSAYKELQPLTYKDLEPKKDEELDDDENKEDEIEEDSAPSKTNKLDDLFAKAFGKKAAKSAPSNVDVDLRINQTILGDVTVYSNKKGIIDRVGKKEFLDLFKDIVKEKVYKKVAKKSKKNKRITFASLSKAGIHAEYNSIDLSLDLKIKSSLRKPLILSMQSKRGASVRNDNKVKAAERSGYLNMYSNLVFNSGDSKPQLNMKFEGSFSVGNTAIEADLNLRDKEFTSERLRLTYDRPEKLQRFMLGDISTGSRNFQENLRLDGLRISKEFFMNPDLQIRPKANESFELETDSEVEVFINNQLRQRFHLRAGIYSLEDIGLYDGANNIRVRIKDEFGQVTEKTSQQFYESTLLKKDLSVYAFSVGLLSNKQIGANNNLIKDPVFSGYYQKGITENLTMGVDAQISSNAYLIGSEMIKSEKLGILKSSIALSGGRDKKSGAAARFEFKPNRLTDGKDKHTTENQLLKNWTVSGEYRSRDFSLLNSSDSIDVVSGLETDHLKARLQTNIGLRLSDDWRGSLNLALSDYYDADSNVGVNFIASRRFRNSINLNVGAHYDSDDKFSVNLQLSMPLSNISKKRKTSVDVLANTKTNTYESKLSLRPHSEIGRNSLAGSLEYVQNDTNKQQNLDVQYKGVNYETSFKARNSIANESNSSSQQFNIGFNSSIACVGSQCATTQPIHDSFALVSGPSNQTTPIAINNGNNRFIYSDTNNSGLPDNYTALIPGKNKRAVVKLDSYRYQSINIAESTLPNGYDTEKTEFEVFPKYHEGFIIKAGGEPATMLDGILVDAINKPLGFKGGQWVPDNTEAKTIAFFSNKAGRFRVTSIPAGKYRLQLFDYPDMEPVYVVVPDLKGKVHSLGNITVK